MTAGLDFAGVRPRRMLDWREEDGRCVLLRPSFGTNRLVRRLARLVGDPHYRIRLDEIGSLIWKACDGRTSLADIVPRLRERFGDRIEPADQRLARFLQQMLKGKMLTLDPESGGPR